MSHTTQKSQVFTPAWVPIPEPMDSRQLMYDDYIRVVRFGEVIVEGVLDDDEFFGTPSEIYSQIGHLSYPVARRKLKKWFEGSRNRDGYEHLQDLTWEDFLESCQADWTDQGTPVLQPATRKMFIVPGPMNLMDHAALLGEVPHEAELDYSEETSWVDGTEVLLLAEHIWELNPAFRQGLRDQYETDRDGDD